MKDGGQKSTTNRQETELPEELGHYGRGGNRPLSLLDQIELGTLDLDLAAWLVSHISRGASFIVGAEPGRAGKSTTMRSLVTFAPGHLPFAIAMPGEICELDGSPTCVISHELSNHPPPAYLWDQDMRDYFALAEQGHMLVANMHADDLDQAHAQICEDNDVPEAHFRAARLFIFLRMEGEPDDARRLVDTVHHSEGTGAHRPVFSRPGGLSSSAPRDSVHEAHCRRFLEQALARSERASEDLRRLFLRSATPEAS